MTAFGQNVKMKVIGSRLTTNQCVIILKMKVIVYKGPLILNSTAGTYINSIDPELSTLWLSVAIVSTTAFPSFVPFVSGNIEAQKAVTE